MRDLLDYVDGHPGMPMALLYTVFASLVLVRLHSDLRPVGDVLWLLVILYTASVCMVATLGWMYNSFLCGLECKDDYLRALLGFDSWVVLYDIDGQSVVGQVELAKDIALSWVKQAGCSAVGIRKTRGIFRRTIWIRYPR